MIKNLLILAITNICLSANAEVKATTTISESANTSNIEELKKEMDLELIGTENGQQLFKVTRINKDSMYAKLGMKVGDIVGDNKKSNLNLKLSRTATTKTRDVRKVDGSNSPQKAMETFQQLDLRTHKRTSRPEKE